MCSTLAHPQPALRRLGFGLLALMLLAAVVAETMARSTGWWLILAFALTPDLAFVLGGSGRGLVRGQMHPRSVPVYNALHRFGGPVALGVLAAGGLVPAALLVGALTWAFHIAFDRAVGYGLRTPDGFQRL